MRSNNRVVRVLEVLNARATARQAYQVVLARPTELEVAKNVVCLLLWLETIMGVQVLDSVVAMAPAADASLTLLVMEASALSSYILHGHPLPVPLEGIPTIVALCDVGQLVDLRFFKFHKDLVARGLAVIRDNLGALLFNDSLLAMLRQFEEDANLSRSSGAHGAVRCHDEDAARGLSDGIRRVPGVPLPPSKFTGHRELLRKVCGTQSGIRAFMPYLYEHLYIFV